METGLRGRTAVIAGGSTGIGKAAAKGLAAEGVNIVLLARGQDNLEKAAAEITSVSRVEILPIPTDLKDAQAVNAAAEAAAKRFGAIHILCLQRLGIFGKPLLDKRHRLLRRLKRCFAASQQPNHVRWHPQISNGQFCCVACRLQRRAVSMVQINNLPIKLCARSRLPRALIGD